MLPLKKWKILNDSTDQLLVNTLLENRELPPSHLDTFRLSEKLHDPYLLPDMAAAVERILLAMEKREKIAIFGDYDVDGTVSTTLMLKFFDQFHVPATYYLPHREKDGYGLRPKGVEQAIADGVQLLITVDNGISSNEAVDLARDRGLDVIVTDHHLQEGDLPSALAVVNPNRVDSKYPFGGICGAGVVYKLLQALSRKLLNDDGYKRFMLTQLDLVALATIADVVPIKDENFALVKFGLISLTRSQRPGIVELKKVAGLNGKPVGTMAVGFYLGPRLNAAGRMDTADLAVHLLMSKTLEEAKEYAQRLDELNKERRELQDNYYQVAQSQLEESGRINDKIFVVTAESWESGLIGLISGRLKEKYSRPALVFTKDSDGNYVGSGRSIEAFHLTRALTQFKDYFLNYGGHHKAAGLTVDGNRFETFVQLFTEYVNKTLTAEDLIPELVIDAPVTADMIDESLVELIESIGPFGEGNFEPVLYLSRVSIHDPRLIGNNRHLKFNIKMAGKTLECVWWGQPEQFTALMQPGYFDVAFRPERNSWNNRTRIQLVVQDVRLHN